MRPRRILPTVKQVLATSQGPRFYDSTDNAFYPVPKDYEALAIETAAAVGGGPYLVMCAVSPNRREIDRAVLDPITGVVHRTRVVLECTPPLTGPQMFLNQARTLSPAKDSSMHGNIVHVMKHPASTRVTLVVIANAVLGSFQPSSVESKTMIFVPSPSVKKEQKA